MPRWGFVGLGVGVTVLPVFAGLRIGWRSANLDSSASDVDADKCFGVRGRLCAGGWSFVEIREFETSKGRSSTDDERSSRIGVMGRRAWTALERDLMATAG